MGKKMADSNQLKRADPVELSDDDPFAELTRIMGFDPRVPVRPVAEPQAAPAGAMPSAAAPEPEYGAASDDLEIDLEKELLGELSLEDDASGDDHFSARAPLDPAPQIDEVEMDPNLDLAIAADLYDDASAGAGSQLADPSIDEPLLSDLDFDAAFERELAVGREGPSAPAEHDQPVFQDSLSVEDAALLAALDPATDAYQVEQPTVGQSPAYAEASTGVAVDPGYDLAMAEVDMDFSLDADHVAPQGEAYADETSFVAPQAFTADHYQQGAIDFDDFEAAMLNDTEVAEATDDGVQDVAYQDHTYQRQEVASDYEVVSEHEAHVEVPEYEEQVDGPEYPVARFAEHDSPAATAEPVQPPKAPVADEPEQEELSLEDELNALLGNTVPRATLSGGYDAPPLTAAIAEHEPAVGGYGKQRHEAADWNVGAAASADIGDDYAGPSYQVAEIEHAGQRSSAAPIQSGADELEFDDGAFQAAFENSLHSEDLDVNTGRHAEPQAAGASQFVGNQYAPAYAGDASFAQASGWHATSMVAEDDDVPDIETIDVPENAVALADDLDIPEVAYEDEIRAAPVFDEFESEFAAVYADPQPEPAPLAQPESAYDQRAAAVQETAESTGYEYAAGAAAALGAGAAYAAASRAAAFDPAQGFNPDDLPGNRRSADSDPFDALDYSDSDEEVALPPYVERRPAPRRRGMMIAAVVGGVVVLGGVGAFALSFGGGSGSDVPAIVKADDTPIKVRPENPGGTTVPNQDNKVYQSVAGARDTGGPAQERLISSAEQPVDMAAKAPEPEMLPSVGVNDEDALAVDDEDAGGDEIAAITSKSEDRVLPSTGADQPGTDNTEVAAVTPRKVRTMIVRPDGTLVPREEPAPAAVAAEPQGAVEAMMDSPPVNAAANQKPVAVAAANPQSPAAPAASALKPANVPATANSGTPATVPVAPSRPADQPVNVVGEVKPEQVAAVSTAAPAAGAWSMQIASQPSEEAAKSTFQDLARRYSGVLGGRDATIVKAEVAGKGTFWRVRVPAGSRNEAISLCESYKAAGGSCFVSK